MELVFLQQGVVAGEIPGLARAILSWSIDETAEAGCILVVCVIQCGKTL